MDRDTKLFLGKILGEIYRMQLHLNLPFDSSEAQIYGLRQGLMPAIDHEISLAEPISTEKYEHVVAVLNSYWQDVENRAHLSGYYELEAEMEAGGGDRMEAMTVIKYLYARHQFCELIEKLDSSNSPTECRHYKLDSHDL